MSFRKKNELFNPLRKQKKTNEGRLFIDKYYVGYQ